MTTPWFNPAYWRAPQQNLLIPPVNLPTFNLQPPPKWGIFWGISSRRLEIIEHLCYIHSAGLPHLRNTQYAIRYTLYAIHHSPFALRSTLYAICQSFFLLFTTLHSLLSTLPPSDCFGLFFLLVIKNPCNPATPLALSLTRCLADSLFR